MNRLFSTRDRLAQYRRVLAFVRPYSKRLAFVTLLGAAATAAGLMQPYFSKLLIDSALLQRNFRALVWIAGVMAGFTVTGFILNILSSYQYVRISANLLFDMRLALYQHLQQLSPRFWARHRLGDAVSRINNDVAEVQRIASDTLLAACSNLVFLVGAAAIMAWFSFPVFLCSVATLPLSLWALRRYQSRLGGQARTVRERSADIGSFLIETLMGFRLVAASNAQQREANRFRERNQSFIGALLALQRTSLLAGAVPGAILTVTTSAIFLYGGKLVIDGKLTTGSLVALMAYHMRLLSPIQNLMGLYSGLVVGSASLTRVFELLDATVEVREPASPAVLAGVAGAVAFENVSFRHDDMTVLDKVSFHVQPGTVCAILGPSGAGKSTMADLLVRLQDPEQGVVRLDGHDIRDLRLNDLRREVILVDQTSYLFHGSIADNIRYGRPDASTEEIIEAARAAAMHERIQAMPQGYDTLIGERGATLSAGERHRITLARALIRKPSVLVLDEPTAALDAETEREIAESLSPSPGGRTAILITHRPALAAIAGQVVKIENGRVCELAVEAAV